MILTGQRRSEVLEAECYEFDFERRLWSIPRGRVKNGSEHVVPLSPATVELVQGLYKIGPNPRFLFTTNGTSPFSGVSKAMERLDLRVRKHLKYNSVGEPWRRHDLRRTLMTGYARLGVPLQVVEKCLNHVSGVFGGVAGVYQRHEFLDERRQAAEIWTAHVDRCVWIR